MEEAKTMKTPMSSSIKLDKDEKGKPIDSTMYRRMIRHSLVSWHSKKQNSIPRLLCFYISSAQLSRLSRRLLKRRDLTPPCSTPWRIINGTSKSLLNERHRDEVSYYEAFLMDSILTGRRIHLGYLMMMYMISCCKSMTRVLPYGRFLTRVFKDVGVDLSRETDFEAPSSYDIYDDLSMKWMKFEKSEGVQFEATFSESMMSDLTYIMGPYSRPSFTEPPHTEIPPYQAPHAPDHSPWMDLSIFECMEDRMDQHQATFEHFQQRVKRIKGHIESQHEEMIAYLCSVFPSPPPQP
ncbi:hypothetical protein AAG906_031905 [Vitis piasezkii]